MPCLPVLGLQVLRINGKDVDLPHVMFTEWSEGDWSSDEEEVESSCQPLLRPVDVVLEVAGSLFLQSDYIPKYCSGAHLHAGPDILTSARSHLWDNGGWRVQPAVSITVRINHVRPRRLSTAIVIAGGKLVAWEGDGAKLAPGFVTLRMQTNSLRGLANETYLSARGHRESQAMDPAQLQCRLLCLAPTSYKRFEVSLARPSEPLLLEATEFVSFPRDRCGYMKRNSTASFDSVMQLGDAAQQWTIAEGLKAFVTPDERTVVISRAWNDMPDALPMQIA